MRLGQLFPHIVYFACPHCQEWETSWMNNPFWQVLMVYLPLQCPLLLIEAHLGNSFKLHYLKRWRAPIYSSSLKCLASDRVRRGIVGTFARHLISLLRGCSRCTLTVERRNKIYLVDKHTASKWNFNWWQFWPSILHKCLESANVEYTRNMIYCNGIALIWQLPRKRIGESIRISMSKAIGKFLSSSSALIDAKHD